MTALDRSHPALAGGRTAVAVAIALADAWRPAGGLTVAGGRDLDVAKVRTLTTAASRGERTMAALVLSLYGEAEIALATLDALDPAGRALVADAFAVLAGN